MSDLPVIDDRDRSRSHLPAAPTAPDATLIPVDYLDPAAGILITEVQREYGRRYGGGDATPLDAAEFRPPTGLFLIGQNENSLFGCGGFRRHDEQTAEIKRMFVREPFRRRGLSRLILAGLEDAARAAGYRRMVLETGTKQPEAMRLYESSGYLPVTPFGHYRDSPFNRCYGRDLLPR